MKVKITIKDVDEQATVGCEIEIDGFPKHKLSDTNSYEKNDIPAETKRLKIIVTPPQGSYFNTDIVEIDVPKMIWDNPTCKVYRSNDILTVEFFLSQLRAARTDFMSLPDMAKRSRVPQGILLNTPTYNSTVPNYLEIFNSTTGQDLHKPKYINRVNRRILGDAKAHDWGRLKFTPDVRVDPLKNGRFMWLEYGNPRSSYLIAVWLPKPYFKDRPKPDSTLDFIVFFTPHTRKNPYNLMDGGHSYPYGLNKERISFQPYARVAPIYMFANGRNICHMLMAAQKKAILVMPMCKYGDWGPFALQDGVGIHRMLKEIAHYLHWQGLLVDDLPGIIAKPRPESTLLRPENRNIFRETHNHIPAISKVITAAFSSNGAIDELFTGTKAWPSIAPSDPPIGSEWIPATFKTTDTRTFRPLWKEIWDLDLGGDVEGRERRIREWRRNEPGRKYRMYHSGETVTRWRPRIAESWTKREKGPCDWFPNMMAPGAVDPYNGEAEEIHKIIDNDNDAWSLVYFSRKYLVSTLPSGYPLFPAKEADVHDLIMLPISFGHAALSSSLEPLE